MTLAVHLLGRPAIEAGPDPAYRFRSRKSWALLAFLLMAERPPARSKLAELLFDSADDPLRALRWNLSEVRRGLGPGASLDGDPVVLRMPPGSVVDVDVVAHAHWSRAADLPGLGSELLEGVNVRGAAGFESWLASERQRLAAASEAVLHEAAQGLMSRGELGAAVRCAEQATGMNPLDENNQALLIGLYRKVGDKGAAARQLAACTRLLAAELGVSPGPAVTSAAAEPVGRASLVTSSASVEAILESGSAAVAAGATVAGLASLRSAVSLADLAADRRLQVSSRLVVAETLIHSLRGMDEQGLTALYEADEIATADDLRGSLAEIRAELGYVDFLRARYDRAELWLTDALDLADGAPWITAKATTYLGCVESDRADYPRALSLLQEAVRLAHAAGDLRREAFATSMLGRVHLLCGRLDAAAEVLDVAIRQAEQDRWLAFLPWPQALRGEVEIAAGRPDVAQQLLEQAFARACQLGDPCWEGLAARGLALVAEANGDIPLAFELLADARARCNRLADPYVWLDAHILDAQCELGRRHNHPDVAIWVEAMNVLSSRTAMREMTVRSLLHAAALGAPGAAAGARLISADLDNDLLTSAVHSLT
jgi:DNA-binding SARP family transcriptional activator